MRTVMGMTIVCWAFAARAEAPPHPFERLRPLLGAWEARHAKGVTRVTYRLLANDNALVESWVASSGKETMTVYHPDGARVLATHYCAQGNQPRLVMDSSSADSLHFKLLDATNLPDAKASRLTDLTLRVAGESLTRIETYTADGKGEASTLSFKRAK